MFHLILGIIAVLWATATRAEDRPTIALFPDSTAGTGVDFVDETISAPSGITLEPYKGDMVGGILFRWPAVPGATGYRLWREVVVEVELDSLGQLIKMEEPRAHWIPWAKVDQALAGMEVRVVVGSMDGVSVRWGVSTFVLRDGVEYRSQIRILDDIATSTGQLPWGIIKTMLKR